MTIYTTCKRCKQPLALKLPDDTTELEAQSVSDNALCELCADDARAALARYAALLVERNIHNNCATAHDGLNDVAGDLSPCANQNAPQGNVERLPHFVGDDAVPKQLRNLLYQRSQEGLVTFLASATNQKSNVTFLYKI